MYMYAYLCICLCVYITAVQREIKNKNLWLGIKVLFLMLCLRYVYALGNIKLVSLFGKFYLVIPCYDIFPMQFFFSVQLLLKSEIYANILVIDCWFQRLSG